MQQLLGSQAGDDNEPKPRIYPRPDAFVGNIAEIVARCFVCYVHSVVLRSDLRLTNALSAVYYNSLSSKYTDGIPSYRRADGALPDHPVNPFLSGRSLPFRIIWAS